MRLTLRTLLAYLDDVLEPNQAREIGEKLAESSVASSLESRIREVLRRRRLNAPTLSGPGAGIDPNAVAEYLDSTLANDAVADVEKICLESDVHLAEVASCHQILTLALGEPVEIPAQLRERMYGLGPSVARVDVVGATPVAPVELRELVSPGELAPQNLHSILAQAPSIARSATPASRTGGEAPFNAKPIPLPTTFQESLPEYLQPRRHWGRILGYALLLLVLLGWGFLTFKNSPFGSGPTAADRARNGIASADNDAAGPADTNEADDNDATADDARKESSPPPRDDGGEITAAKTAAVARTGTDRTATRSDAEVLGDELDDAAPPYRKKERPRTRGPLGRNAPPPAAEPLTEPDEPATVPQETIPKAPRSLGRYVSAEGVALWYSASDEAWHVIPPGSQMYPGTDMAAPLPFEAALEIEGGLATLLPGTAVAWMGENAGGAFGFYLRQGRVLLRPASGGHATAGNLIVGVGLDGSVWRVELSEDAVLGLEATPPLPTRYEQSATPMGGFAAFHLSTGRAKLVQTGQEELAIELKGPASLQLPIVRGREDGKWAKPELAWQAPDWMQPPKAAPTGKSLTSIFEKHFSPKQPVELTIPAVTADPNPRVSELATACLALIGDAGSLLGVLQSAKHEESRQTAILGLREWLLQDDSNRDLLKAELARRYPTGEADIVYQLLWGYSPADAQTRSASSQIIDWMGHREDSIRALAFHHAKALTGRDFGYHANASDLQRTSALKQWKLLLNRNDGCLLKPRAATDAAGPDGKRK